MSLDPLFAVTLRLSVGSLFAYAVAHKLAHFRVFLMTLSKYLQGTSLDKGLAVALAGALVVTIELAVVAACAVPFAHTAAGGLAVAALRGYGAAMANNLLRGNLLPDCGCSWGAHRQPVSRGLMLRNLCLAALALLLALPVNGRPLTALDLVSIIAAWAGATILYSGINLLLAIAPSFQEAS
jgi:hypothetical protein